MKLRLPESLPHEVVDEWIDNTFRFSKYTYEASHLDDHYPVGTELVIHECRYHDGSTNNYVRPVFELFEDTREFGEKNDEEGYITWQGQGEGMVWTAEELTEEQIDEILKHDTGVII